MTTTPNHSNGQQIHTKSSQQDIGGSKRWNQSNRRTLAEVGGYIRAQKMWPLRPTFLTIFCENIYIYLISLTDWVGSEIRIMRFLCSYEMILHMSFFLLDFINLFLRSLRWKKKNTPERPSEKSIILTVTAETYQLKAEAQSTKQRKNGIARLNLCSKILR
jgi:hypothetical protein